MSEKTEKATSYKLLKARKQGQVSKSPEINTCMLFLIFLALSASLWSSTLVELKELLTHLILMVSRITISTHFAQQINQLVLSKLTILWLPLALASTLIIVVSNIVQTGFVWSLKPLVPDFKRLDAVKGFKRLFSKKSLFDAGKNLLKILLISILLGMSLRRELNSLLGLMRTAPAEGLLLFMGVCFKILLQLTSLLTALGFIDLLYSRWQFAKNQRMSKQELKDEFKQREGDPIVKSKIRQLQQQLRSKTASLAEVQYADVVITNPTHLAIALKYDKGIMPAPKVVCKAQGLLAQEVKLLAQKYQIPMIEHKLFARTLFASIELNQWIKKEHFPVAAMIFRDLYQNKLRNT